MAINYSQAPHTDRQQITQIVQKSIMHANLLTQTGGA
jgi:hypothetical protein